jgi:hypothetical protein
MIKNPSYKADVKLAKDGAAKFSAKGNSQSVSNVNQAQGPRTGNSSAHAGKRAAFVEGKQERAPLATYIEDAYSVRGKERADTVKRSEEGISPNTRAKFKK